MEGHMKLKEHSL